MNKSTKQKQVTITLHVNYADKKSVKQACKAILLICRDLRDDDKRNHSDWMGNIIESVSPIHLDGSINAEVN